MKDDYRIFSAFIAAALFAGVIAVAMPGSPVFAVSEEDFTYSLNSGNQSVKIDGYTGTDRDVVIPDEIDGLPVTIIGDQAFMGQDITSISIPESVTSIGDSAFLGCTALTSLNIPESLTSIADNAINQCYNLTKIYLQPDFGFFDLASTAMTAAYSGVDITRIHFAVPSGLEYQPQWTDQSDPSTYYIGIVGYEGTGTEVVIPSALGGLPVKSIELGAFYECSSLTGITIPDGVTSIGYFAFGGCTSLTEITLPASLTSIDSSAFNECTELAHLYISSYFDQNVLKNETLPTITTVVVYEHLLFISSPGDGSILEADS